MPGRIPLESLAGIAWNPWPESNGITGRDHVESVAGIVWNLHVHDRIGGQRLLHLGYAGAQQLFDTVANAMIEKKQDDSPVGYFYM